MPRFPELPLAALLLAVAFGCARTDIVQHGTDVTCADWADRSTGPAVLQAVAFDTQAEVDAVADGNPNVGWEAVSASSSGGSARIAVPALLAGGGGLIAVPLAPDGESFGAGSELYMQYRQYTTAYYATHVYLEADGTPAEGWWSAAVGTAQSDTAANNAINIGNHFHRSLVQGATVGQSAWQLWEEGGITTGCSSTDLRLEPAIDRGPQHVGDACENDRARYGGLYSYPAQTGVPDPLTGGFTYPLDGWHTILVHVHVRTWGAPDSTLEVSAARDGGAYLLLKSRDDVVLGPADAPASYETLWLMDQDRTRGADSSASDTFTRFDEAIVSTAPIPPPCN